MIIQLDDQWFIEDDGNGYTIYRKTGKVDKNGNSINDITKYPPTLAGAIEIYARNKTVDQKEIVTLKEYVNSVKKTYEDLKNSLEIRK